MKRIRRITMEIVQRRQQLTLSRDLVPATEPLAGAANGLSDLPEACPLCGSGWILLHEPGPTPVPDSASTVLPSIHAAFASLDLHLHSAPDGRVWACRRSFDQLCNRLKETI